jgi:predicted NBD/HSP70 family sugar kinase
MKAVVLDIGATAIKSGVFEYGTSCCPQGTLSEKKETPANAHFGGPYIMETAKKIIAEYSDFSSIGISTAGQVDSEKGFIRFANENIPNYTGTKVKEIFEKEFQVPVAVENDVNSAALGEAVFGAGKKSKDNNFLCLTYGTGIGGAIVIDRKIYKGAAFSAGEFGHIITHGNKTESGYYEKYASTTALVKNVQTIMPELDNGRKILKNMENPAVKEIVDNWIDEIAYGLASLIHIFNPSLIILGGGIMENDCIIESLEKKVNKYIMPSFANVVLTKAALGNDAGLWGAGFLAGNYY